MNKILSNLLKIKNMKVKKTKIELFKYVCKKKDIPTESYFRTE